MPVTIRVSRSDTLTSVIESGLTREGCARVASWVLSLPSQARFACEAEFDFLAVGRSRRQRTIVSLGLVWLGGGSPRGAL